MRKVNVSIPVPTVPTKIMNTVVRVTDAGDHTIDKVRHYRGNRKIRKALIAGMDLDMDIAKYPELEALAAAHDRTLTFDTTDFTPEAWEANTNQEAAMAAAMALYENGSRHYKKTFKALTKLIVTTQASRFTPEQIEEMLSGLGFTEQQRQDVSAALTNVQ